jgi:hypothetical protein
MTDTTAKIAAKNDVKHTGITPDVARQFYDRLGTARVAIVELASTEHTIDVDGKKSVKLDIQYIEIADDEAVEDHLRELQRALYNQRQPQKPIDSISDQEPTVEQIVDRGSSVLTNA